MRESCTTLERARNGKRERSFNFVVYGIIAVTIALAGVASDTRNVSSAQRPHVKIETSIGQIEAEIYTDRAPVSAANFLRYVREGRYDDGAFYRAVTLGNQPGDSLKIEVIQGGLDRNSARRLPPIEHETNDKTGILHGEGILSMARGAPGTASSEFFIVVGDQPSLDFKGHRNLDGQGFAAFGKVTHGMQVVRKIQQMPSDEAPPQRLHSPVKIISIRMAR